MAAVLRHLAQAPGRLLRSSWEWLTLSRRPVSPNSLPVAGLDESRVQSVLYALRQGAESQEECALAESWLAAVVVAQVASDRLVRALEVVEATLGFWRQRLLAGQHLAFLLLGRGPAAFLRHAAAALRGPQPHSLSATDQIERRVVLLSALRGQLADALAGVTHAASALHLHVNSSHTDAGGAAAAGPGELPVGTASRKLLDIARQAILTSADGTRQALEELARQQAQLGAPPTADLLACSQQLGAEPAPRVLHAGGGAATVVRQGPEPPSPPARRGQEHKPAGAPQAALASAAAVLGLDPAIVTPATSTATGALQAAAAAGLRAPVLVSLPAWVRAPSHAQQHWLRYSLAGAGGLWAGLFLYRHSPLAGSRDLEVWARAAVEAVVGAWREHVVAPLAQLRGELFRTFRQRRSIVSPQDFEADKASLLRMLADFQADMRPATAEPTAIGPAEPMAGAAPPAGDATSLPGMDFMMACYEDELKKPIRNLVNGQLARSLLIQVQKLKVDTESAMLEMDQILKANELSIALVAAVPSFLVAGALLAALWRWLMPRPPDPKREALPARLALVELQRALAQAHDQGAPQQLVGAAIFCTARVYRAAWRLFSRHDMHSPTSEWRSIRVDLVQLAAPAPLKSKLASSLRLMQVYSVFKP